MVIIIILQALFQIIFKMEKLLIKKKKSQHHRLSPIDKEQRRAQVELSWVFFLSLTTPFPLQIS